MKRISMVVLPLLIAMAMPAWAGEGPSAQKIVDDMIDQDPLGFGGGEAQLLMALVNNRKQERKRKLRMYSRTDGELRRSFVRFTAPADIAGTSFLGIDDDGKRAQHLYLPALTKVRRISGSQRNASFVGTDYSYSDLDFRDVEDSKKKRLGDEKVGKYSCYVLEAVPTSTESEYSKISLWIDKKTYLPLRIRFYGRNGRETKRLTVQEVKKVNGRWIIYQSKMVDLKKEHTTIIRVVDVNLKRRVADEQFTVRALSRG